LSQRHRKDHEPVSRALSANGSGITCGAVAEERCVPLPPKGVDEDVMFVDARITPRIVDGKGTRGQRFGGQRIPSDDG
jgi:hypothetical protein